MVNLNVIGQFPLSAKLNRSAAKRSRFKYSPKLEEYKLNLEKFDSNVATPHKDLIEVELTRLVQEELDRQTASETESEQDEEDEDIESA